MAGPTSRTKDKERKLRRWAPAGSRHPEMAAMPSEMDAARKDTSRSHRQMTTEVLQALSPPGPQACTARSYCEVIVTTLLFPKPE